MGRARGSVTSGGPGAPHRESRLLQAVVGDTEARRCESTHRTYPRGESGGNVSRLSGVAPSCGTFWCGSLQPQRQRHPDFCPQQEREAEAGEPCPGQWRREPSPFCAHTCPTHQSSSSSPKPARALHPLPASTAWRTPGTPEKGGAPPAVPTPHAKTGRTQQEHGRKAL